MLPKKERLVSGDDIRTVIKTKQIHFSTPLFYFTALVVDRPVSRWVAITPKRLGSAVVRNRARRVAMSAVSIIRHSINEKLNIVIMLRRTDFSESAFEELLLSGLRRSKLCPVC